MEILTLAGDGENEFPQQIAPFPEAIDLAPALESGNVPPQKLRPIRRSPAEDPPSILGKQMSVESFEGAGADNDVDKKFGSGMLEESLGPKLWCGLLDDSSSSSEDDDDEEDLLIEIKGSGNRKRKRKTREKMKTFLQSLVMKIMEKQEQMNKQLIEMIEKRERERALREEAWKRHEMERMKRDEEIRAQEMARGMALISFLQNTLGQEIQIPQPSPVMCMAENVGRDGGNHTENNIACNSNNRRWQEACDFKRGWKEAEMQALIMLRSTLDYKFRAMGMKCAIWEEISAQMHNMGYDRSGKKCKEKWENMNKYFRKSMENGNKHLERSKTCYFHDLEMFYSNGLINPGNGSNFSNNEHVSESDTSHYTNHEIAETFGKE